MLMLMFAIYNAVMRCNLIAHMKMNMYSEFGAKSTFRCFKQNNQKYVTYAPIL